MLKKQISSVLILVCLFICSFQSVNAFSALDLGTQNKPEKLLFCTFEEGTTNVNYTPHTIY